MNARFQLRPAIALLQLLLRIADATHASAHITPNETRSHYALLDDLKQEIVRTVEQKFSEKKHARP